MPVIYSFVQYYKFFYASKPTVLTWGDCLVQLENLQADSGCGRHIIESGNLFGLKGTILVHLAATAAVAARLSAELNRLLIWNWVISCPGWIFIHHVASWFSSLLVASSGCSVCVQCAHHYHTILSCLSDGFMRFVTWMTDHLVIAVLYSLVMDGQGQAFSWQRFRVPRGQPSPSFGFQCFLGYMNAGGRKCPIALLQLTTVQGTSRSVQHSLLHQLAFCLLQWCLWTVFRPHSSIIYVFFCDVILSNCLFTHFRIILHLWLIESLCSCCWRCFLWSQWNLAVPFTKSY